MMPYDICVGKVAIEINDVFEAVDFGQLAPS